MEEAAALEKAAADLAEKPFLGIKFGRNTEVFLKKNVKPTPNFERMLHKGAVYKGLRSLTLECKHCAHTTSLVVENNVPKQFNASKWMDHFYKCPGLSDAHLEEACIAGCQGSSKTAKETLDKLKKRQREEAGSKMPEEDHNEAAEFEQAVKAAKCPSAAERLAEERQRTLDQFITKDPPCTPAQYILTMWYMAVFFVMARIPFFVMDTSWFRQVCALSDDFLCLTAVLYFLLTNTLPILQFLRCICPSFEKMMPSQGHKWLAGEGVNNLYAEAIDMTQSKLDQVDGKITVGFDGHTDGRGRQVLTVSLSKFSVVTFFKSYYFKTRRHTGVEHAEVISGVIKNNDLKGKVLAVVADNTSNMRACFDSLLEDFNWLFFLGCCVHILDLITEDLCGIAELADILRDVHFIVSFIRAHGLLHEEFLLLCQSQGLKGDLKLFPKTRFAYAYLMALTVVKFWVVFGLLIKTTMFKTMFAAEARRHCDEGKKSFAKWTRFKSLATNNSFIEKTEALVELLVVFSNVLHYVEGNSVPLSHVYPLYHALHHFVLNPPAIIKEHISQKTLEAVCEVVRIRWLGGGRKIGLMDKAHLACFAVDPYARNASSPSLYTAEVREARDFCFAKLAGGADGDASLQKNISDQLLLFGKETGTGVWTPLFSAAKSMVDNIRKSALLELYDRDKDARGNPVKELLSVLKACPKPTLFFSSAVTIYPTDWNSADVTKYVHFCHLASDLSTIVGHTAGTERLGKGYGMIMTQARTCIGEDRIDKLQFIFNNWPMINSLKQEPPPSFNDFVFSALTDGESAELKVCFLFQFVCCPAAPGSKAAHSWH